MDTLGPLHFTYNFCSLIERIPQYRGKIVLESSFGSLKHVLYMEVFCIVPDYGESTKRGSTVYFSEVVQFELHFWDKE